jgi:hypothetical protein
MGIVYSAHDEVMDRVVAVKVLMADLEAEPDTRARFYREAQSAGRLLHPNIITIFDMGEEEGRIFIVMELLKGDTLAEFLRRPGGVPLEQKVALMVQACEGLGSAHAHGIFHRDIKPGNLFVLQDGTLKVLDFGVARLASSTMTASGFIIGTPDYMSPEQARGREIDQRSDIFSAAGVFYYMLTGRKPFAAPDLPSVLRRVQMEDPEPLPDGDVPQALARVVMKSLAKDPALRHQWMAEFSADLTKVRRYYEAETRQIAVTAHDRYESISNLLHERAALAGWLGLPVPEDEPEAARRLRDEHASFVEQRHDSLLLVPFTRPHIAEIAASLCAEHQPLSREVARLREVRTVVDAAVQALAAGRVDEARQRLEQIEPVFADAPRVVEERERCQAAAIELEARQARMAALIGEIQSALAVSNWSVAVALCDQALAIEPQASHVIAMRVRARDAEDREARQRERDQQRAADRARRAIDERRFDAAEQELALARQLEAPHDRTAPLAQLLSEAREAAVAEAARAQRAAETLATARAHFQAGRRDEAIATLEASLDVEPDAPGVRSELGHLRAEARRRAEAEQRHAEAGAHSARAALALEAGDHATASREADDALAAEPGHAEAARIRAVARATIRERERQERERLRRREQDLRSARQALRVENVSESEATVARILAEDPHNRAALDLVAEIAGVRSRLDAVAREKEDDTVAMAAPVGVDDDDTVRMLRAEAEGDKLVSRIGQRLRGILTKRGSGAP